MPVIADLTLWDIAQRLRAGTLSAVALAESAIERHARFGTALGAHKMFLGDAARRAAAAADGAFAAGGDLGPLHGIPVTVKDLFGMREHPIFAGSPRELPERFRAEGPIVAALRRQMAVITGRTHTTEFAYGEFGYGTNTHWGTPRNPWDAQRHRVPGGSSSGAAVSLWEGTSLLALGSDTTGSVREPASLTATVGLKITHGRWSLDGIVPCSPSLDTPGPLARTVADIAYGFAALDPYGDMARMKSALDDAELSGVRIGVAEDHYWSQGTPSVIAGVKRALDELGRAGARFKPVALPEAREAQTIFDGGDPCAAELYAFLSNELPDWLGLLNRTLRPQIEAGGRMTAADYLRRWRLAARMAKLFGARWQGIDVIALPSQVTTPPVVDDLVASPDKRGDPNELRNSNWASLLGLCAISIPVALDDSGMPVGLQLVAPPMGEERLLAIACACERTLGTARRRLGTPPMTPD